MEMQYASCESNHRSTLRRRLLLVNFHSFQYTSRVECMQPTSMNQQLTFIGRYIDLFYPDQIMLPNNWNNENISTYPALKL